MRADTETAEARDVRLDDRRYLMRTPEGITDLDLVDGPRPARDPDAVGWCEPRDTGTSEIRNGTRTRSYDRFGHPFPCRLGGVPVDQPAALPIPAFAGVTVDGWSAWVADGIVHGQRRA